MLPCNLLPVGVTLLLSLREIFGGSRAFLDWPVSGEEYQLSIMKLQISLNCSFSAPPHWGGWALVLNLDAWRGREEAGTPGSALSNSSPSLPLPCLPPRMTAWFAQKCPVYATCPTGLLRVLSFPPTVFCFAQSGIRSPYFPPLWCPAERKFWNSLRGRSSCDMVLLLCRWRLSRADSCLTGQLSGFSQSCSHGTL